MWRRMKIVVVKYKRGMEKEVDHIYIGRKFGPFKENSKWANSFIIGKDGTREEVIAKYEAWLQSQPELLSSINELRGKTLICWCAPEKCHGEVLERLLDGEEK